MKFIHTADWHLGNRMHDVDRRAECRFFLNWLKEEIVKQNAETLIIAGDVYDVINPSSDAENLYYSFLASLNGTCCRNVIIVGGNHDSGAKLDSSREILEPLNIHVVGSIANKTPDQLVFELKDQTGATQAICAAVPFVREIDLINFYPEQNNDGTFEDKAYTILYQKVLEAAKKLQAGRNIPLIATGHLYAANLEGRRSIIEQNDKTDDGIKSLDPVGNLGSVSSNAFPKDFDYVALGHIHYSTMVNRNPRLRYSGSPFVMGFDEANIPRHILCIQIEGNNSSGTESKLSVTEIEIPQSVSYKRIKGNSEQIKEQLQELKDKGIEIPSYLELEYKREPGVDIHNYLQKIISELEKLNCFTVSWKPQLEISGDKSKQDFSNLDMDQMHQLNDSDVFTTLIQSKLSGCSEQEKESAVQQYLPLFMEIAAQIQNGDE